MYEFGVASSLRWFPKRRRRGRRNGLAGLGAR
jgi:hypothetical protein